MKKLTKFMSLLLTVAMVLTMVACQGVTDPSTSSSSDDSKPTGSTTDNGKTTYVVKVQTAGGMPLEKVDFEIYSGSNLVDIGATAADGTYSAKLAADKEYIVKLSRVPAGYKTLESYSFTGNTCVISLESSVITGEKISSGTKFQLGDIMYDFEFTDSDGITRKLSETLAEKKMVMLNFWYSDCSWCYKEFPAINTVYGDFKSEIEIFALNDYPGETIDDVKAWKHSEMNLQFPMGLITNGLGIGSFGGGGWPMTVIIDRYGMVAMAHAGAITSEYVWKQIFTHFAADNYNQVLVDDYNKIVSIQEPTEEFPGNDVIAGAINQGDITVNYYPANEKTDGEAAKYVWPFVETTFNGETCIKASNNRVDSSYAILYADVELKAGQAVGFDYIISSEQGMDVAIIIVNGNDIYQMSGYDTNQQWKTCYPWVALEDGTYTLAICYMKDGTNNVGDDTIYIDNMRVVDAKDIEVDSYIPRQAAVQKDGTFSYVDIFYNEKDGYYHVDSVDGPLLLANLMGYTQFNKNDYVYNMADGLTQNGIDFRAELTPFASYASNANLTGYCTVTQELADLLRAFAKIKGFENSDDEWLKLCEYYQAYGPGGTQLEDPIKGLAPFSAPQAVLGSWQVSETTGELEFVGANGETGDHNLFYYDRAIMPRGKIFAFTPAVSGAYRVTSHHTSANGIDAWVFDADSFITKEALYTYSAEERMWMTSEQVHMVYYMEAGKTYYIDIAFWDVYEVGYIPFDLEFLGETYDMFRLASPGPFTYIEDTEYIIAGGVDIELGEDGYYYHVKTDKDGNKVRGSKLYADFSQQTTIFNMPLTQMIEAGAFDFSKDEYDQEIMTYLKNHNGDVEATREYLKKLWGNDYELYADAYKLEEILAGTFHGTGEDLTDEIKAFLDDMIDAEGDPTDGCVVVTAELAELLQKLMDKFTFEGVEQSWRKLCYYYDYMGR